VWLGLGLHIIRGVVVRTRFSVASVY